MRNRISVLIATFLLMVPFGGLWGQNQDQLLVKITPQVLDQNRQVSWEEPLTKVTSPGKPVVLNIEADPLTIRITVTPFVRGKDFLLVVQGNVRESGPRGVMRTSTLQSLVAPPDEQVLFFPLGREPGPTGQQMVVLMQVGFQGD